MRLETELREQFPHGHQDVISLCLKEMDLHSQKNYEYAGGGDPMGNFKRVALLVGMYPKMNWSSPEGVALMYMIKQVDATLWGISNNLEKKVEGVDSRLADISVYAKIVRILLNERSGGENGSDDEAVGYRNFIQWAKAQADKQQRGLSEDRPNLPEG